MTPEKQTQLVELNRLLSHPIPNFKKIETAIEKVSPALLSLEIEEDVGFSYLIDYYLRYIDANIVKNILQNPMFSHNALIELFNCHITSIHKAILLKKPPMGLFDSYWSYLSKAEYAILFKHLLECSGNTDIKKMLLQKFDLIYLKLMTSTGSIKSNKVLNFFKNIGPEIKKLAAHDMNIYEYVFGLAIENSDEEYLNFLEQYTTLFVQLRVASGFVEEIEALIKKKNSLPTYNEIVEIARHIPEDTLGITLEVFHEKKWLTQNQAMSILESSPKNRTIR